MAHLPPRQPCAPLRRLPPPRAAGATGCPVSQKCTPRPGIRQTREPSEEARLLTGSRGARYRSVQTCPGDRPLSRARPRSPRPLGPPGRRLRLAVPAAASSALLRRRQRAGAPTRGAVAAGSGDGEISPWNKGREQRRASQRRPGRAVARGAAQAGHPVQVPAPGCRGPGESARERRRASHGARGPRLRGAWPSAAAAPQRHSPDRKKAAMSARSLAASSAPSPAPPPQPEPAELAVAAGPEDAAGAAAPPLLPLMAAAAPAAAPGSGPAPLAPPARSAPGLAAPSAQLPAPGARTQSPGAAAGGGGSARGARPHRRGLRPGAASRPRGGDAEPRPRRRRPERGQRRVPPGHAVARAGAGARGELRDHGRRRQPRASILISNGEGRRGRGEITAEGTRVKGKGEQGKERKGKRGASAISGEPRQEPERGLGGWAGTGGGAGPRRSRALRGPPRDCGHVPPAAFRAYPAA